MDILNSLFWWGLRLKAGSFLITDIVIFFLILLSLIYLLIAFKSFVDKVCILTPFFVHGVGFILLLYAHEQAITNYVNPIL